jgi:hypothetical protein
MNKITPDHLSRRACVYIRQSTPGQVQHNLESQRRQYALVDRARTLGWQDIEVIDDDLGISGSGTRRPGFERLLRALCDGQVGAVFSRLDLTVKNPKVYCNIVIVRQRPANITRTLPKPPKRAITPEDLRNVETPGARLARRTSPQASVKLNAPKASVWRERLWFESLPLRHHYVSNVGQYPATFLSPYFPLRSSCFRHGHHCPMRSCLLQQA